MPLRNKYLVDITYQNQSGVETPILDARGNDTGEKTIALSAEKTVRAFVSAKGGKAHLDSIGMSEAFDRTWMTPNMSCDIEVGAIVSFGGQKYRAVEVIKAKPLSYIAVGMNEVRYDEQSNSND